MIYQLGPPNKKQGNNENMKCPVNEYIIDQNMKILQWQTCNLQEDNVNRREENIPSLWHIRRINVSD